MDNTEHMQSLFSTVSAETTWRKRSFSHKQSSFGTKWTKKRTIVSCVAKHKFFFPFYMHTHIDTNSFGAKIEKWRLLYKEKIHGWENMRWILVI